MKKRQRAKANIIKMKDKILWEYNMFEVPFEIEELWLSLVLQLNKHSINDSADLFYSELMELCREYVEKMNPTITFGWEVMELTPAKFLWIVNTLATGALEKASEWDKSVFKFRIEWPNDKLVEFKKENKEKLKEYERLQKAVKPTEKKASIEDVLKRLDDIEAKVGKPVVYTETPSWTVQTPSPAPVTKPAGKIRRNMSDDDILNSLSTASL